MVVLTVVMWVVSNVFGIHLAGNGQLLVMSTVIGFSGALISLFMSKSMAKRSMGVQVIEQSANETEQWLVSGERASEKGGYWHAGSGNV